MYQLFFVIITLVLLVAVVARYKSNVRIVNCENEVQAVPLTADQESQTYCSRLSIADQESQTESEFPEAEDYLRNVLPNYDKDMIEAEYQKIVQEKAVKGSKGSFGKNVRYFRVGGSPARCDLPYIGSSNKRNSVRNRDLEFALVIALRAIFDVLPKSDLKREAGYPYCKQAANELFILSKFEECLLPIIRIEGDRYNNGRNSGKINIFSAFTYYQKLKDYCFDEGGTTLIRSSKLVRTLPWGRRLESLANLRSPIPLLGGLD